MISKRTLTSLSLAILLAGCDAPLGNRLGEAQTAFDGQDYFAARDHAQAALRDDSANAPALELLARSQLAMGLGAQAKASLERLAALPDTPDDYAQMLAESYLQEGDTEQALAHLAGQEDADAWRLRALAAAIQGDEAATLEAFSQGRAASGDKLRLHAAQASYFLARGDAEAARDPVRRAQELGPDRIETFFVTARLAQLDEDSELATRAYLGILERTPLDRPAMLGAIAEMGNLGRIDLLRPLVKRGFEAYPNDPEFVYLTARLKGEDGDWAGVRELLQQRESSLTDHPDSRGLYAEALYELGQFEQARSHLAPLYRRQPGNIKIARTYAKALLATGENARAGEVIAPLVALPDATDEDRDLAAQAAQG